MNFNGKRFLLAFVGLLLFITLIEIGPALLRGEAITDYYFPIWVMPLAAGLAMQPQQKPKKR
ncbi:hypothetical protein [Hymenobacter canadensis]|uniref:DUF5668 domain-containing protein n=1 Tax=Hymenobacter canadensis TaxID=2999067 RepID=A0ABY7LKU9_9BACT|nr:hypothetical protein [Hymenobacter canadensis]WBA41076.1 hypothetical protein O3303_14765 [Hymenobacter canadensis]